MKRLLLLSALAVLAGCTDATYDRTFSYGVEHHVVMYSGGKKVGEWTSTGKPRSTPEEDGWYFVDKSTDQLTIVTGDVVITQGD